MCQASNRISDARSVAASSWSGCWRSGAEKTRHDHEAGIQPGLYASPLQRTIHIDIQVGKFSGWRKMKNLKETYTNMVRRSKTPHREEPKKMNIAKNNTRPYL